MNLNKLKYSVQTSIPSANIPLRQSDHHDDPPEIQRQVESMEGMRTRMKNIRDITGRQASHLQQESASKKNHAKAMESGSGIYDKGPSNQILQRITEFTTLTSGNSMMLAESLSSQVSDPCNSFIREDIADAKKKKDIYDKAKSDYFLALERNRHAESALKKASQKDKMFFQEKFRESGQVLDEAQDRYETLSREIESTLSILNDTSSTVVVKSLIAYLESFYEYHETCLVWLKNLMETDSIKNWRNYVEEKEVELVKRRAAGCGPSKKVYGNSISELSRFDKEMNPNALPIPTPIFRLIRFLNENCLEAEGIFRLSGNQNEVDVERRKIDGWEKEEDYPVGTDPHLVAGLLKKYLRDLPEPLLTYDLFDDLLATKDLPESQACTAVNKAIKKLPEVNRATFYAICQLCDNVQKNSDKNKMSASNLGIVFAPSCLYGRQDDPSALEKSLDANGVVTFIIQHVDQVFQGEPSYLKPAKSSPSSPSSPSPSSPLSSSNTPPHTLPRSPIPRTKSPAPTPAPLPSPKGGMGGGNKSPIPSFKSPDHPAPAPPPPVRGGEWTEHFTEEGNVYWYNAQTGKSTWTDPMKKQSSTPTTTSKPPVTPLPHQSSSLPTPPPSSSRRVLNTSTGGGGRGMRGSTMVTAPINPGSPGGGGLGGAPITKPRSATVGGGPVNRGTKPALPPNYASSPRSFPPPGGRGSGSNLGNSGGPPNRPLPMPSSQRPNPPPK